MRPGDGVERVRLAAPAGGPNGRRRARAAGRRAGGRASSGAIVSSSRSRGTNSAGSIASSPARSGPPHASMPPASTAQSSWPKWRSSHQSRSAPPMFPYATTNDARPDPGARGGRGEPLGGRQRMAALARDGEIGQVLVDVEERRRPARGRRGRARGRGPAPPRSQRQSTNAVHPSRGIAFQRHRRVQRAPGQCAGALLVATGIVLPIAASPSRRAGPTPTSGTADARTSSRPA